MPKTGALYEIDSIGGNCPVQAEGVCCKGRRFYFRARGDVLQMHITKEPLVTSEPFYNWGLKDEELWFYETGYSDWPEAGWVSHRVAEAFIDMACILFVANNGLLQQFPELWDTL